MEAAHVARQASSGVEMGGELDRRSGGRGPDGLAPLENVSAGPHRMLVERLRTLRADSGLTYAELAGRLKEQGIVLSASRLSKFLNGHELPSRKQVAALHQVRDAAVGAPTAPNAVRETQQLLYAVLDADRMRKPLRAREFDLEEAQEQLEHQRAAAAAELGALRQELERERDHRRRAEGALRNLSEAAGDHYREIREVTADRDAALRRVAELEDQVQQGEALLRLREQEAEHLAQMVGETARELDPNGSADQPSMFPFPVGEVPPVIIELRDEGRDAEADEHLAEVCRTFPAHGIAELWQLFRKGSRKLDAHRLLVLSARLRTGVSLCYLYRTGAFRRERALLTVRGLEPSYEVQDALLKVMADETPLPELVQFVQACRERDDQEALDLLAPALTSHPAAFREALRQAGLKIPVKLVAPPWWAPWRRYRAAD
ncbi:hypothetical protein OHA44_36990 [Streptomyces sp. NBC_00144]|uniref:helix-turn-helix domain-containing protein n=1 Tax=Streptomyces sp. NBC_00144 TaxID=2975665 RepID=UPI003253A34A